MIIIDAVCGNSHDTEWTAILREAKVDRLKLDQWDAQKNRFRRKTEGGMELAVSLQRGTLLRNGDILLWDEAQRLAVIADIALKDVLVVETAALLEVDPQIMLRTAVELGHALGNQHWPAVVKGTKVYVPLAVDRKVMASVMKTHAFEGIQYEFMPGDEVIPYLAPHETRRLFGGAETPLHDHSHAAHAAALRAAADEGPKARAVPEASGHTHSHDHDHPHPHEHSHSHQHPQEHGHH